MFRVKKRVVAIVIVISGILGWLGLRIPAAVPHQPGLKVHMTDLPSSTLYSVVVPAHSAFHVIPVVSAKLQVLPQLVAPLKNNVVAAVNAGFFDPSNQKATSFIVVNQKLVGDPRQNAHLMDNPALQPYLQSILMHRSAFRVLYCDAEHGLHYEITRQDKPVAAGCTLIHSLQAGPDLMSPDAPLYESFVDSLTVTRTRDPIGIDRPNARSAVGITANGDVILAMATMKPVAKQPAGLTLTQLGEAMRQLGAVQAMALDGGSSATFWTPGQTVYGKLDAQLRTVRRPVQSALAVVVRS